MLKIFKKLFGSKPEEEFTPIEMEEPVQKKSISEIKGEVYNQIAWVLEKYAVHSSHSRDEIYSKLKKSLQEINGIINSNKEYLAEKWELRALEEKILNYKDDRTLSVVAYDMCKIILGNRFEHPSILKDKTIRRILDWYGLYF